jgi:hypothetical protein
MPSAITMRTIIPPIIPPAIAPALEWAGPLALPLLSGANLFLPLELGTGAVRREATGETREEEEVEDGGGAAESEVAGTTAVLDKTSLELDV